MGVDSLMFCGLFANIQCQIDLRYCRVDLCLYFLASLDIVCVDMHGIDSCI